ncbi:MAG: cytochrome c oxidase subunit II [Myxococcota bacterium]|nr:cytochrome c oxidase subunit II [Myxococcota bacterium]
MTSRAGLSRGVVVACVVVAFGVLGCTGPMSTLEPASRDAASLAELFWALTALTLIPALIYIAVMLVTALRARRNAQDDAAAPRPISARAGMRVIVIAGAVIPGLLVFGALGATLRTSAVASAAHEEDAVVTIDVVGHQYWWEVIYPEHGIVTANEIHVPADRPIRFRLASADVIHSFWVPRLFGKRDMTPGHIEELRVEGIAPGVYRGQCYEFCGVQHALMGFELIALPPAEYERWVRAQRALAAMPAGTGSARGLEVYLEAECAHCHAIRGLTPSATIGSPGPDLTHLASRRTLGAALFDNDRGHLAGWILDPQQHKPGVRMPPTVLTPGDLHALLDFLEGLR